MPLKQDYEFEYQFEPEIPVRLVSPSTGREAVVFALIDTGATLTAFDVTIAHELGIDLSNSRERYVQGIEGNRLAARVAEIELWLLDEPELSLLFPAAFLPNLKDTIGNLLGLDVLSQFDLGLQHGLGRGSLGVTAR